MRNGVRYNHRICFPLFKVKAKGSFRTPPHLDVTICDFKILNSSFVS